MSPFLKGVLVGWLLTMLSLGIGYLAARQS